MRTQLRTTLTAAALFASTSALALPIVDVSDSLGGNAWPAPTSCATAGGALPASPLCNGPIINAALSPGAPPAPGFKLVRPFTASLSGDAGAETFAVTYEDGVIGDYVNGRGPLDVRADSNYVEKRIYTGVVPAASYVVGFKIDQVNLAVVASASELRLSEVGFTIQRNLVTLMSFGWQVSINSAVPGPGVGDFVNMAAPAVSTSVTPTNLPVSAMTFFPDISGTLTSPGATFLLDLGPMFPKQKFVITYDMYARIFGTGFGNGFASIGDPFGFGGGPGIDWGGLSAPVPAPAPLALFGLGALALGLTRRRC
jgi:hypothetical protein